MSTRYYTEDSGWPGSDATTGSQLKAWELAALLQWNQSDPVSQKEIDRNNVVYGIQNNRNPFIDHPEYAALIWDPNAGISASFPDTRLTLYPNPAGDFCNLVIPGEMQGKEFSLRVCSLTGIPVITNQNSKATNISIDLRSLPGGIYFVSITMPGNSGIYHGKITHQ
jgi:hypothetical protein